MARKTAASPPPTRAGRSSVVRDDADFDPLLKAWGIPVRPPRPTGLPERVVTEGIASPWAAFLPPGRAAESPDA
jgi:hypothetical protein